MILTGFVLAGCESDQPEAPDTPVAVEKIDLNSASAAELEALPGIGKVMAQRIIEGRPYDSIEDVTNVEGVGEGTLERIRHLVVAE